MFLGYTEESLKRGGGFATAKEIHQQPYLWAELYTSLLKQKDEIKGFLNNVLNIKGIKIIISGAGTSAFIGNSTEGYLRRNLGLDVEAIDTTDIVAAPENYLLKKRPTLLISHARSGNSPESIATIKLAEKLIEEVYFLNITCNTEGRLADYTSGKKNCLNLFMPKEANDIGFAMTSSFTCMLLTDLLLPYIHELESKRELIEKISIEAQMIISEDSSKVEDISRQEFDRLIYLGSGDLKGCAQEAALKSLELSNGIVNATYYTCLGFRHGPKASINDSTLVGFFVSNHPYTKLYDIDLIREIAGEPGNRQLMAVMPKETHIEGIDYVFKLKQGLNDIDPSFLTVLYIIYAQMLAFYKSWHLGIQPDNPNPEGRVNRVVKGVTVYEYLHL
jgi:tagatose-6-phosphate ketose/aldose isomerase